MCSSFISVTLIDYPNEKLLRLERIYLVPDSQVSVHQYREQAATKNS